MTNTSKPVLSFVSGLSADPFDSRYRVLDGTSPIGWIKPKRWGGTLMYQPILLNGEDLPGLVLTLGHAGRRLRDFYAFKGVTS